MEKIRKIIVALLLFALLFSESAIITTSAETKAADLAATVETQIRAFAKSINKSNADDTAASAIAKHGITGGGKKLSVGKTHALTATLWNSELMQVAAVKTCTAAIDYMQRLDKDHLPYVNGFCTWNGSGGTYGSYVCIVETHYDASSREASLFPNSQYTGKQNSYDDSLVWMAGITAIKASFQVKKVTKDEVTYSVTYTVWDRFDFDTSQGSGFDKLISGLGALLFREFDWESKVTFDLTVPYSCTHSTQSYHFTYDAKNRVLTSDNSDGYTPNAGTQLAQNSNSTAYYHELENAIRLYHNKPWVMEYTVRNPRYFAVSPWKNFGRQQLSLMNYSNSGLMFQKTNVVNDQTTYDCYGIQYSGLLSSGVNYIFRLENEIDAKGNNMIYLTIINADNGSTALSKSPMDDYYENVDGVMKLKNSSSNYLNGVDLFINYVGNESYAFHLDYFDLRIWENGKDGEDGNYYKDKITKPTCTARGYTTRTCECCGYSFKTSYVSKIPHVYTDVVTPPTVTAQGYTTHTCKSCSDSYVDSYTSHAGDLDKSGVVDVDDVIACLELAFSAEDGQANQADFDKNGKVDVDDVIACLDFCFGE